MVWSSIHLPTELLEETLSYLTRPQLRSVIFVCKEFANVGRLLLYKHIDLGNQQPHVQHTLNLLYGDRTIAVKIIDAVLTTQPPLSESPWIRPNFFANSVNLRSLELRGFPFSHPEHQGILSATLQQNCPKLVQFTYRPGTEKFPESGFELSGLNRITWQSSLATIDLKVAPLMTASIDSLTHISFKGMVVHRNGQPYDHFLGLRFPNLCALELGSLIQTNTQERTNTAITDFILAHGLIKHLSLGRKRNNDMFFQLREDCLHQNSLPNLQSFEGFPENVAVLARKHVSSLFGITSLSLYCWRNVDGDFHDVREMFGVIEPQKLSLLQSLRVELNTVHYDHKMDSSITGVVERNLMDRFSYICPGITRWQGNLPPMYADDFKIMFLMHENLETIVLPRLSLMHIGTSPLEFFLPIASERPMLERVVGQRPPYTELEHTIYSFTRTFEGKLQSVIVENTRDISIYGIESE